MNEVKVLIFDLDNTLINYGGVTKKAWLLTCQKAAEKYSFDYNAEVLTNEIVKVNDLIWEDESKRPKGNFSFDELRTTIVKEALSNLSLKNKELVEFLVKNYSHYKHQAIYMFNDVPNTLKQLKKRGYKIALLTNGDGAVQREKLNRFEMEALFDEIFIDGEQGIGKPEKEAYDNVLKKFGVHQYQACMIGDHYLWEVVAPKHYGLHAIWVDRGALGVAGNEDVKADYVIKNIGELLDIFN